MNIAIYSRKSCLSDKGESTHNQIDMCKHYVYDRICPKEKCKLSIYIDEGFSAKNIDRPEFKKMLADSEKGLFSHIVCYKLDRISRNVSDFSNLIEKFNRLNISFVCIKEQFDTSVPMGRAMMYMASVFAQLERETIAERVKDNMLMLSKSGRWLGGTTPLGFESFKKFNEDTKKYEFYLKVNNDDIKVAKEIYLKFLETHSLSKTKEYLDNANLKSKLGNYFSIPSIKKILTNPVYCSCDPIALDYFRNLGAEICIDATKSNLKAGVIAYNKRNYCKNHGAINPISDWIISSANHKGVINGENWVKVNIILSSKNHHKSNDKYSLLSGKIICAKCHSKMISKLRNNKYDYDYICSSKLYNRTQKCSCKNLNGRSTDLLIIKKLSQTNNHIALFKNLDANKIIKTIPYNIKKSLINELIEYIYWDGVNLNINFKN